MTNVYTIGFTQKNAIKFFESLKENNIELVIDIRLNNTSQLAGFAKYPDIEFFLNKITNIRYIHDKNFAPEEYTLKRYKKGDIEWKEYVVEFEQTMLNRKILDHIKEQYDKEDNICLLCSENSHIKCHRSLVAEKFKDVFNDIVIINL